MRLEQAREGQVVRNTRNGHFYRFVRREGRRVRIRPLELFPNGLLQEKTTDTIVESDLDVVLVGAWTDTLYVKVRFGKTRATFERELAKLRVKLERLEAEALVIPPKERGSHANKVKSVAGRVQTLERGLADRPDDAEFTPISTGEVADPVFKDGQTVITPSGRLATVVGSVNGTANIKMEMPEGISTLQIDPKALLPTQHQRLATVG